MPPCHATAGPSRRPAPGRPRCGPQPDEVALAGSPQRSEGPGSLLALSVIGASSSLNLYCTQPLLPLLGRELSVAPVEAALTVSASSAAVALGSPIAGLLSDRLGRRRTIVLALFALVVPTLLAATAGGIRALWAWRFLQGLAVPGVYAVGIAYATAEWQGRGVGRAMAMLMVGNVLGGFLGRLVAAIAASQSSWRAAFLALGAITLLAALAVRRWLPPGSDRPRPPGAVAAEEGVPRWRLLLEPQLLATFAVGLGILFTTAGTFTYVTFHLAAPPYGLSTAALGWIFAVYLFGAAALPFVGRWLDALGSRRAVAGTTLLTLAGGAVTLLPGLAPVVAGLVLVSTAGFVTNAAATAHLAVAAGARVRSLAAGVYVSCYYLGGALGAVLPAWAWNRGGWPATVAFLGAAQLLASAGALLHWKRPPGAARGLAGR